MFKIMVLMDSRKSAVGKGGRKKDFDSSSFRIMTIFFVILGIASVIIFKLYFLQVSSFAYYEELAKNQHSLFSHIVPKRGEIFLKDKDNIYPVAVNKATKTAYAVPKEIKDVGRAVEEIARILELDKGKLWEKFNQPEDMYEVLKRRLNDEEERQIENAKISGIHLTDETYRYYPARELAAQVLGFVGWKENDFAGRYGTEAYFETELKGEAGSLSQDRDNSGQWISTGEKEITHAKDGKDLILTIDHSIQYETEKILESAVSRYEADRGTIIVMESKTGRILSMANYPSFNPNNFGEVEDISSFRNLALSSAYECGSVFKTITLASAIDNNKINSKTTFRDTGQVAEAGYVIKNSDLKAYGTQTMTEVLEKSLNTGAIYAEKLLGNKNFSDYIKRFGFGDATGIELPGESGGNISNLKNLKSDIQFFTASFGQGITVTPIQLISAYNVIADGGILLKPQIVEKIIDGEKGEIQIEPADIRKVISQSTANEMSWMLESVVSKGHGKRAGVPGYLVAGKTGTAQVASTEKKGYEEGKNIGSFVGFAPVENPEFTVLVRIDNPKAVEWAESSAAPSFGELMKFLLDYRSIEPTQEYTQKDLDLFNQTHTLSRDFIQKEKEEEKDKKNDQDKEVEDKEKEN